MTAVALLVAVGLTGCSGGGTTKTENRGRSETSRSASPSSADAGESHEVTLAVEGLGKVPITYRADTSGFDEQTLPWRKTETVRLSAAERKAGYVVSVVPGPIKSVDGTQKPAPCFITVDGKAVADNDGGRTLKGCSFRIG
ncbi:hypothetical protein ACFWU3_15800 [Streptomyces sp. NPDC058685]|uniref:hypothetical protein n=1 Tax=Streptomyces sp. NPDC058685 TaxID=3346598 RepID=UPI003648D363